MRAKLYTQAGPPGLRSLLVRVAFLLGLLATVVLVVYFEGGLEDSRTGAHPGFWDCVYFSLVTITTVGYGDIVPVETSSRLVDAFLLTPIRFIIIFTFLGTAYQLVLKRFQEDYRMKRAVDKLKNHVIICGYGATGRAAVQELLLEGRPANQIVVVASSETSLNDAADLGVIAVRGDATHENVLQSVAIDRAAHVLVCPGRDDTAVLIALTAHELNPNAQLIAMCHEAENVKQLERSRVHTVITPASVGGNLMAAATRREHLVETLQEVLSVGGAIQLDEREAQPEEVGKRPGEVGGMAIVRLYRGTRHFDVPNLPTIESGDILVYIAAGSVSQG